jgi:exodeoxyribonuclease-3
MPEKLTIRPSSVKLSVKVIAWNIRAGGGVRVDDIFQQLLEWDADVVALSEFRGTAASQSLAEMLRHAGWSYQVSSVQENEKTNGLLVAAKWPVTRIEHRIRIDPLRWLPCMVCVDGLTLFIGAMHVPNRASGRKDKFQRGVLRYLKKFPVTYGLLVGDTNSGLPGVDEESPAFGPMEENWIANLSKQGWVDGFRHLHRDAREFTWYSPNGKNGFRLDYVYLNPETLKGLNSVSYAWGKKVGSKRREALSDHAAILTGISF